MKEQIEQDFRVLFSQMDPLAVINRQEFAALLCRTPQAIGLLAHRGRLPRTAFPGERKACWFVKDVRDWLEATANNRPASAPAEDEVGVAQVRGRRVGRPRSGEQ